MSKPIPAPRLSATVLLLRDAPDLQVLMVERHYQIDFASGALVFPGGKANDEDASPDWSDHFDGAFERNDQTARIASVRESFEESGILLARPASRRGKGAALVGPDVAEKLSPFRAAVDRGEQSFLELVREHDLVLALDTLVHFGHWITPTMMPAQAHTAMIWMDMVPATSKALRIDRTPIRCGVSHETTAAASVARVPARMTE